MTTPTKRGERGLLLRKGIWHIDKVIHGKRVCESTKTRDRIEAEVLLAHRSCEARQLHLYGRTFREAGVKFVAESQRRPSIGKAFSSIENPMPSLWGKAAPILVQQARIAFVFRTAVHEAEQRRRNARRGGPERERGARARGEAQSAE